jgi:SHAQKYF class myb-like DNA-binding protein
MDDMSLNLNLGLKRENAKTHQNLVISTIDHSDMKITSTFGRGTEKNYEDVRKRTSRERSNTLTEENHSIVAVDDPSPLLSYTDFFKDRVQIENGMNYFYEGQSVKSEHRSETRFNTGRWSAEEHQKFVEAMFLFGNEWKRVQQHIKTRSSTQARSHAQKFFIRLRKKFFEEIDQDETGRETTTNERVFNWIKENVNWETIHKVIRTSGNYAQNFGDPLIATENFLNDRKDKLCKIILNLISNSSKTKRKAFANEDECESHRSVCQESNNFNSNSHLNQPFLRNFSTQNNLGKYINTTSSNNLYQNSTTSYTHLIPTNTTTPLVSTQCNPHSNSYISIVTINLPCPEKAKEPQSTIIKSVNKDVNKFNGMEALNEFENKDEDLLRRTQINKMLMKKGNLNNKNNIVCTGNFNIVNGNFNLISAEKHPQEKEQEKDPFKLTFEENNNMTPNNAENDFCKINFDLDLDHFFNN